MYYKIKYFFVSHGLKKLELRSNGVTFLFNFEMGVQYFI